MVGKMNYVLRLQATHITITKVDAGTSVHQTLYKRMIGSLLNLTTSRPDIAYAVGVYARYQANLKDSHLLRVKRIIKYMGETADYGISDTSSCLVVYYDAD
ncbi:unnamed protein product [Rhodiola kirilowii]